tara:strand:- start:433 stop:753 length:321 start_codon:yes stop_codon:yes gene_type:complete
MDIYIVRKYLEEKETRCIDTSRMMTKAAGKRIPLDNLAKCNLNSQKSGDGLSAVRWWGEGKYEEVAKYCLKDSQLTLDVWKMGVENGNLSFFDEDLGELVKIDLEW